MTSVESSDGFLFSSSAAEDLNNSYRDNLEHLVKMWKQMGLCHQDISARINTMKKKFQDITSIMVEEDQKRMIKFKDLVEIKKAEALDLWQFLRLPGDPEAPATDMSLNEQQAHWKEVMAKLEEKRNEATKVYRSMVEDVEKLSIKLGDDDVFYDKDELPSGELLVEIQNTLTKMKQTKEEREQRLFSWKEEIVVVLNQLGQDLDATVIFDMIDGDQNFDSLRSSDMIKVKKQLKDLKLKLHLRNEEVKKMVSDVCMAYERLQISEEEQCPMSSGKVCGVEELAKEENFELLRNEWTKMQEAKERNMEAIISSARTELEKWWMECLVGEAEQANFFLIIDELSLESRLAKIDEEIEARKIFYSQHQRTFKKVMELLELSELADDLRKRMDDPDRLFKSRGRAMVKEEQDRRKVKQFEKRADELLLIAEETVDLMIYDEKLSVFVQDELKNIEELFGQPNKSTRSEKTANSVSSINLSKTRSGKSFNAYGGPSPMVSKHLGVRPKSPAVLSPRGKSARGNRIRGRPVTRRPPQTTMSESTSRPQTTMSESQFFNNVPSNSTMVRGAGTDVKTEELSEDEVITLKISDSMAKLASDAQYVRSAVNNNLNHQAKNISQVRPRESQKPVKGRLRCIETPTQSVTARDRGLKAARKLRRSNSCSDIVRMMNKPGSKLKTIREGSSCSSSSRPQLIRSNSYLSPSKLSKTRLTSRPGLQRADSKLVLR